MTLPRLTAPSCSAGDQYFSTSNLQCSTSVIHSKRRLKATFSSRVW